MKDWIINNDPLKSADKSDSAGHPWYKLNAGVRMSLWPGYFHEFLKDPNCSEEHKLLMLLTIYEHGQFLSKIKLDTGYQRSTSMAALLNIAAAFPEFTAAAQWQKDAVNHLKDEIENGVYADGVHKSLTYSQHWLEAVNAFSDALKIMKISRVEKIDKFEQKLMKMLNYGAVVLWPDGSSLNNGFDKYAKRFNQLGLQARIHKRQDWLYIASNGRSGFLPKYSSNVFPQAGHLVLRSDYLPDGRYLFFNANHNSVGQRDRLHISMGSYGQKFLIDRGSGDKHRDYLNNYAAHNTISESSGSRFEGDNNSALLKKSDYHFAKNLSYGRARIDQKSFTHFTGNYSHERRIYFINRRFFIIVDDIKSDRMRALNGYWHFDPSNKVKINGKSIETENLNAANLELRCPSGSKSFTLSITKQPVYIESKKLISSPSVSYKFKAENTRLIWLMMPHKNKIEKLDFELKRKDPYDYHFVLNKELSIHLADRFKHGIEVLENGKALE